MDKIKIWITVDENQMVTDYSLTAKKIILKLK